ncbi:MAG: hypothetical protein KGD60_15105 [Candidatus Thorarchaeota archaeon]|nr:hypothetical protein [Candidatus Thorarchaeota archaeon]
MRYTVIDRFTGSCFKTDDPKEAYQEACLIEEEGHDYAIKKDDKYVSRLSVYLAY